MTPEEYLIIERELETIIIELQGRICNARMKADTCPPPTDRRRAVAADIVQGAVIWYEPSGNDSGQWCWHVVEKVRDQYDAFKAFVADDGCRYGLDGAFVRVDRHS